MAASSALIKHAEIRLIELSKATTWQQFERWTRRYRNAVERKVRGFFLQQEDEIIASINAGKSAATKAPQQWLDWAKWQVIFEEFGQLFLPEVVGDKGNLELEQLILGVTFDIEDPKVSAFLGNRSFKFAFETNAGTQRALQMAFQESILEGEGIPQLTKRINAIFTSKTEYQAERMARSEVIRASNFAAEQAYLQSGVVTMKEWIVSRDNRLCPFCKPMAGKKVVVGFVYFQQGDVAHGTSETGEPVSLALNYEDIFHPPLHPQCRCTLVPVVDI